MDVYIPKGAVAGEYQGTLKVTEGGILRRAVLVRLTVYGFELSDVTHFPAWAYADRQGVEQNFLVTGDWRKGSSTGLYHGRVLSDGAPASSRGGRNDITLAIVQ